MAFLEAKDENGVAFRIDLPESGEAILGRSPERANVLIPAGSVSGCHCSIVRRNGAWVVKDLGSTNGTQVNGEVISEAKIFRGDTLSLGNFSAVLAGEDVPVRDGKPVSPLAEKADRDSPVEYIQSTSMKIEPRSASSPTVKVLPTQFRKKSAHTRKWVALIAVFAVLAVFLAFLFFKTLVE